MPRIEYPDDLAEWLADQAGIYGTYIDEEMKGHPGDCKCRVCWIADVQRRIRDSVKAEHAWGNVKNCCAREA